MNEIFLVDKNTITYTHLLSYINEEVININLSITEKFILDKLKKLCGKGINSHDDLITKVKEKNKIIKLKTSGTTGKPKEVLHTIESITKNVKINEKYHNCVWGLTFSLDKMAFYQVLFQSLFNRSMIVNLFGYNFDIIKQRVLSYKVTHISATPTFYRLLISEEGVYDSINQISLGGESSDKNLIEKIKVTFPNAKIKNIYASTETASLFASTCESFIIPEKYKDKIKIDQNLLYIHQDLVGKSEDFLFENEWFNTKDIVHKINENEFVFIGRDNAEINVSGFKINPQKIESLINSIDYVVGSFVYSKKNSVVGNILCCDIKINQNKTKIEIKEDFRFFLEKHEIPTIINVVDEIKLNENMKISRK